MNKKEIAEIKKQFTPRRCSINRICGCYVDGEKVIKTEFASSFLNLDEEEAFKYFEIFRKALSGTDGKNLHTLEFPLNQEAEGGTQEFMLKLRNSALKDDSLLTEYYTKIIENYEYVGNYLILVIHDVYDIPGKTTDDITMDDASDEVYEYILTCICPVNLSEPGLSYNPLDNVFINRVRDWVVDMPQTALLFPAFNDRRSDIHSILHYSKDTENLQDNLIDTLLGCTAPLGSVTEKEAFQSVIEESLGETISLETIKNIHNKLTEMNEESKELNEPLILNKQEVKNILAGSGVEDEQLEIFEEKYDDAAGEDATMFAGNVMNMNSFEVKTPDVIVKVKPERTDLIEARVLEDGREYLVIPLEGEVVVNGITIH